jgi:hypothetical protein
MLNEWRVDSKRDAFVERSLAAIEQELSENYDRVLAARNYHLDLYPDILAIVSSDGNMSEFQRGKFRGMRPPRIQTAAYDIAIQSAILSDVPIEDAKDIATAYAALVSMRDLHQRYSSAAFSQITGTSGDPRQFANFLRVAFMDFLYSEEETLDMIGGVIKTPDLEPWWKKIYPERQDTMAASPDAKSAPQAQAERENAPKE